MFGYRIIKEVEIENLKSQLADANGIIDAQTKHIADLLNKIVELEKVVADLNESKTVKVEITEEKPVKKVRRKSSKKTTKKEE
jgi:predicted  nucleic acid-binding Zn-ribbon protein